MLTQITIVAAAAAILLSTASASFAGPKNQRAAEPIYFSLATGEQS